MSYLQELRTVAVSVHTLMTDPGTLDSSETDLALAGHTALIELLRQVSTDVILWGTEPEPVTYRKPTLDRHPTAHFQKFLQDHTVIPTDKVSTLLETAPSTVKGRAWQQMLAAATGADTEWRKLPPSLRPVGDERWSHLAHLTPIAEALTHLDLDLADHLTTLKRPDEAAKLRGAARSGLAVASREVALLAAGGDLPRLEDRGQESVRILIDPAPSDLPEALSRMGHRLVSGGPTTPAAVMAAVMAAALTAEAASSTMEAAGLAPTAERLRELAKDLKYQQRLRNYATSPSGTAAHGSEQARQIQQLLLTMKKRGDPLPLLDALSAAKQLPITIAHIRDAVEQQFRASHWYVKRQVKGILGWGAPDMTRTPVFLGHLQKAAARAEPLGGILRDVHPHSQPPAVPTPSDIVRNALNRRGPPPRPGLPGLAKYAYRTAQH